MSEVFDNIAEANYNVTFLLRAVLAPSSSFLRAAGAVRGAVLLLEEEDRLFMALLGAVLILARLRVLDRAVLLLVLFAVDFLVVGIYLFYAPKIVKNILIPKNEGYTK